MLATSSKCQLIVYILRLVGRTGDKSKGAEREALASKKSAKGRDCTSTINISCVNRLNDHKTLGGGRKVCHQVIDASSDSYAETADNLCQSHD